MKKLNLTPDQFTRIDNDINGNPRYYLSVVSLFDIVPDSFESWGILEKCAYIDKVRKGSILEKYRGKKFGGGYVVQSYNLQEDCNYLNNFFNSMKK